MAQAAGIAMILMVVVTLMTIPLFYFRSDGGPVATKTYKQQQAQKGAGEVVVRPAGDGEPD